MPLGATTLNFTVSSFKMAKFLTFSLASSSVSVNSNPMHDFMFDYWEKHGDSRVSLYTISKYGLYLPLGILTCYLAFVIKIGPTLMKGRDAFGLKRTLLLYNTFMVVLNLYFFCYCLSTYNYGLDCFQFDYPRADDYRQITLNKIGIAHLYLLSKFLDLFDTLFFVFRKKQNQVTNLHLYHHTIVPALGWVVFRIIPTNTPVVIFALLNSFIHVLMYAYYALAALGESIRPYLWWKKYLTLIQIYQFVAYSVYSWVFAYFQQGYPLYIQFFACTQPIVFLILFSRFYLLSYSGKKQTVSYVCPPLKPKIH